MILGFSLFVCLALIYEIYIVLWKLSTLPSGKGFFHTYCIFTLHIWFQWVFVSGIFEFESHNWPFSRFLFVWRCCGSYSIQSQSFMITIILFPKIKNKTEKSIRAEWVTKCFSLFKVLIEMPCQLTMPVCLI